jgi:formylglycine-generating enzyme required for sulfatase activity
MPKRILASCVLLCVVAAGTGAQEVRITSMGRDRGLTWTNSAPGGSATVLFATNLQSGPWLPNRHIFPTSSVTSVALPPPHPGTAFYRIQVSHTSNVPAGMVLIPGGPFVMGDIYEEGFTNARPAHVVYVSSFYMDQFEVTNEDLRRVFQWAYDHGLINGNSTTITNTEGDPRELLDLDGDDHGRPVTRIGFTNGVFTIQPGRERHPATGVTWYGAAAYCNYRSDMEGLPRCVTFTNRVNTWVSDWICDFTKPGYRLPTEAEWEKAARGGLTGHHYPWESYGGHYSSHIKPSWQSDVQANYGGTGDTKPVGSYPPNGYEVYDVAGNVWEWVWDYYKADWYLQPEATEADTKGPRGPWWGAEFLSKRIIRGGSVGYYDGKYLICASRHSQGYSPTYDNWVVGFRCARTP